jgi:hypothetical protein
MLIVLAFQVPVDGWLTKLSAPVVRYAPGQVSGLRGPWDIPVEDFLYGFALVTAALLLWERQGRREHGATPADDDTARNDTARNDTARNDDTAPDDDTARGARGGRPAPERTRSW